MVSSFWRGSALNRKLLRDLLAMRGQALAIALVIAGGVTMLVAYFSNFDSLRRTTQAYYTRQRFGDVFASLERAPASLESRLRAIPGVAQIETRVVENVTLDVPGLNEPASGRLVSLSAAHRPALNDLYLRQGRWIEPDRPDEVLANEAFCRAHHFEPGARIAAIVNGRRRWLTIVGVALSPEYVFTIRPGEMIPDDRRYGIFWMERRALASAFNMEGGFNDVVIALEPQASADAVLAAVDHLLDPYGGRGAIPRSRQHSAWTLENELKQLQTFGFIIPTIFLGVAMFVLNVALTRAVALQRPQIATLKGIGYDNRALAWHYLKWALIIAAGGVLLGVATGVWMGTWMIGLYNRMFRFPQLEYRLSWQVTCVAAATSLGVAALGAWSAVWRTVRIPPAEAMRPESPPQYRQTVIEVPAVRRLLSTPARMVLRNISRQPMRSATSVLGIACAGGLLVTGFSFFDAMEIMIDTQFNRAQRQDITLTFAQPRSSDAQHALMHLPGVLRVEPMRAVPARLRAGYRERTVSLLGLAPSPSLNRIVNQTGHVSEVPSSGLLLSQTLATALAVHAGDQIDIEVLEGARPIRRTQVTATIDDTMGLSAYMNLDALHRLMREGDTWSGAFLHIDRAALPVLYPRLKTMPAIAGVSLTEAALRNFRTTMAENMDMQILWNVSFAGIIAFGVVYNAARMSLAERSRELASLRVLGFTRAEISLILLGELAVLTAVALPIGELIGYGLCVIVVNSINSEVFRIPLAITPRVMAWSALTVIAASAFSALIVRRRLDRLDLISVLKVRE
jgi:putative ABC transport system permease protein